MQQQNSDPAKFSLIMSQLAHLHFTAVMNMKYLSIKVYDGDGQGASYLLIPLNDIARPRCKDKYQNQLVH